MKPVEYEIAACRLCKNVWVCGFCNNPYTRQDAAEACCTCRGCKGPADYTGIGSLCKRCGLVGAIKSNEKFLKDLLKTLEEQRASLVLLDTPQLYVKPKKNRSSRK